MRIISQRCSFFKKRKKGGDHDCLVQHVVPGGVPLLEGGEMQRTASGSQRATSGREREGGGGRRSHAPRGASDTCAAVSRRTALFVRNTPWRLHGQRHGVCNADSESSEETGRVCVDRDGWNEAEAEAEGRQRGGGGRGRAQRVKRME